MRENNIPLIRRQSGGGTVYHDMGNSCYSIIIPRVNFNRQRNAKLVSRALQQLDIPSFVNERHDIVVENKKIRSAFKLVTERALHHGTMLIDTDLDLLNRYLKTTRNITAKGVDSVRSTVTRLREYSFTVTHLDFCDAVTEEFYKEYNPSIQPQPPTELGISDFENDPLAQEYYKQLKSWEWTFRETPEFTEWMDKEFEWGSVNLLVKVRNGVFEMASCTVECDDGDLSSIEEAVKSLVDSLLQELSTEPVRPISTAPPRKKESNPRQSVSNRISTNPNRQSKKPPLTKPTARPTRTQASREQLKISNDTPNFDADANAGYEDEYFNGSQQQTSVDVYGRQQVPSVTGTSPPYQSTQNSLQRVKQLPFDALNDPITEKSTKKSTGNAGSNEPKSNILKNTQLDDFGFNANNGAQKSEDFGESVRNGLSEEYLNLIAGKKENLSDTKDVKSKRSDRIVNAPLNDAVDQQIRNQDRDVPDVMLNYPSCAYCGESVVDNCINAVNATWHPNHFFCGLCGKLFPPGTGFLEHEGIPYCEHDYFRLYGMKCGGCGGQILGEYVSALDKDWHSNCFGCTDCKQPFPTGNFFEYDGNAYCEQHYHMRRSAICAVCANPVAGPAILATSLITQSLLPPQQQVPHEEVIYKYHPEHFRCSFCNKQIGTLIANATNEDGTPSGEVLTVADEEEFREREGKPFCAMCFARMFGVAGMNNNYRM
ncbi:hypothetical protein HK098_000142 [Nowakowskiella sp. JEL0407]|nr:hypothetical protein HK098_000142 [Nowakowskiella sp. JEL0407]